MCDINKVIQKEEELDTYLNYVVSDIINKMMFEPALYAAYAAHNELTISTIPKWYREAEEDFVTVYNIDLYLQKKYEVWKDEDIDYFYEKEVHKDGTLYECGGYWFKTE